jgi:hypothetical protein
VKGKVQKDRVNERPECFEAFQDHVLLIGCEI